MSYTISFIVMPIGTSASPPRAILPASANTLVPLLFSVPIDAKASGPFIIIHATFAKVSTLFIFVGLPHSPLFAGNGGLNRGIPLLPSIEAIRAVSSPQTNAPAPSFIFIERLKSEPNIFFPRKPLLRAMRIESFSL